MEPFPDRRRQMLRTVGPPLRNAGSAADDAAFLRNAAAGGGDLLRTFGVILRLERDRLIEVVEENRPEFPRGLEPFA